jgi:hypothetical protein
LSVKISIQEGLEGPVTVEAVAPPALRVIGLPDTVEPCVWTAFDVAAREDAAAGAYQLAIRVTVGDVVREQELAVTVEGAPLTAVSERGRLLRGAAITFLDFQHQGLAQQLGLTLGTVWEEYVPCESALGAAAHISIAGPWRVAATWPVVPPPDDVKQVMLSNETTGFYWACEFDTSDAVREVPFQRHGD